MPHLDTFGASLYYETDGTPGSPPLLLVHAGVATLRMWDEQVTALAREHYVIRYDTRGFGQTEAQSLPYSDVDDAIAILDQLGIDSITVIGASRGGRIAIDLALTHPDRVRGLVTLCSNPGGFESDAETAREKELFAALDELEAAGEWEKLLRAEVELWDFGPLRSADELDPAFVARAYELALANIEHGSNQPPALPLDPPAFGRVEAITVPSLVTVGAFDIAEMMAAYEYLLATLPLVTGHVFASAAHLPNVEFPHETEAVLLHWLSANAL